MLSLAEQSFHSTLLGDQRLKHHLATQRFHLLEKASPKITVFNSVRNASSGTASQPLCFQTPRNRLLDSHVTPKESTKPWLDLHTNWWPENKDFQELMQMTAFPRWQDQACIPFAPCCLSYFLPVFLRNTTNTIISISQPIAKRGTISDCWICHLSVHYVQDPWHISL